MRVNAPNVSVSQGGSVVAIAAGRRVTTIDVASGERHDANAATTASIVALAPSGNHAPVVAADDQLAWLTSDDAHVASLPGRVVLARLADDGSTVVVTRSDSTGTFVVVLDAPSPVFDPIPLGHASVVVAERDTPTSVVLAGRRGDRSAWDGSGEPYLCRVNWTSGSPIVDWNGEGVDGSVGLAKASAGWLVIAQSTRLVSMRVDAHIAGDDSAGSVPATIDVGQTMSSLALSPDAAFVAFVGEDDHVYSVQRDGGTPADRGFGGELDAMQLAIADDAGITLVGLRSATEVVVLSAPPDGELAEGITIEVPRSVFRNRD